MAEGLPILPGFGFNDPSVRSNSSHRHPGFDTQKLSNGPNTTYIS